MASWATRQGRNGTAALAVLLGLIAAGEALQAPARPAASAAAPKPKATKALPPPVTSLDVTVTDPAGKPVEGAFVVAVPFSGVYRPDGELSPEKVRTSVTNRTGEARLDLPPGPWNVTVKARGLVPQTLRRVASGPLAVRLEKGGSITGVVRDGTTGRPVPKVRVLVEAELPVPTGWSGDPTRNEAATDQEGRFRLEGIGRKAVTLAAIARGFARAERPSVRSGARVELFLFPGASLAGVVTDDLGRPVKDATVRAEADTSWGAPSPERTDAKGEFRMAGVRAAEYTVVAREGGRAPGIAVAVVEPEGETTVPLTLSEGGYATGRIVDTERRPLAGRIRVESFGERILPTFVSDMLTAEAKADGMFALGPLPLGTLGAAVSAPRHGARQVQLEIPARGRTADLGDVVLEVGLAIQGRVRERGGRGVAGATVRAALRGPGGPSEAEALTEEDGTFQVAGLGPGRHDVTGSAPGYVTAHMVADTGGEAVELLLEPAGQIEGRVADADGVPVEGAFVFADEQGGTRGSARVVSARAEEADGGFVLRDLAPGTYGLEVSAESRGRAAVTGVRVVAGRSTGVGTITLAPGGVVRGVVVDPEGVGIPGALVGVRLDMNRWRAGLPSTQSGASGAFQLEGVPIGPVHVSATHPAYAAGRDVTTTVTAEKDPEPLRLVLQRGGRLEGRSLYRDGRPFSGGRVSSYSLEAGAGRMGPELAPIEADGSFVVDHVAPGRTAVTLMAFTPASPMMSGSSENILTSVASRELEVRDGETTFADLSLRDVVVEGRVTRGGEPEPNVLVSVMSTSGASMMTWVGPRAARALSSGPPPLAATTREDGRYELVVFTPGPAYVELHGGGQSRTPRTVEIPDADRFELDLSLGTTSVSGIVVESESGSPVPTASLFLRRTDGKDGGSSGESGADGRFVIAAEPGEYTIHARAADHAPASLPLSVGSAGVDDVRVELERGGEIRGRLVDATGRPAAGYLILVTSPDGHEGASNDSGLDGSFRIGGLEPKPHAIVGGSELAGYAFRTGVVPGGEPLELRLRPAGRIDVHVVDAADQPVRNAYPRVETVDGVRVRMPGRTSGPTDAGGLYTLSSPPGLVEVVVRDEKREGRGSVSVASGASAPLTLVLRAEPPKTSK